MKIINMYDVNQEFSLADVQAMVGTGWSDILGRLIADLEKLGWDGTLSQVKEKFGGLRFYIDDGSTAIHKRIAEAERESTLVCEDCGQPGKVRSGRWPRTLCDACLVKFNAKRAAVALNISGNTP